MTKKISLKTPYQQLASYETAFSVKSSFQPKGDQGHVINKISRSLTKGNSYQTIRGATGTGKTYVMAKIIESTNRPALILAHNKTLAAQLFNEFKEFFPNNTVEYFVSYYDYYQPEAYVAKRDLFIEKDSSINEEIDRMRLKATASLISRRDTIIVSSVSCIYGLGSPDYMREMYTHLKIGLEISRDELLTKLIEMQYSRNDDVLARSQFRVLGDIIDIIPAYMENGYRIEFFGDAIEAIYHYNVLNRQKLDALKEVIIFPAKHFVTPAHQLKLACKAIEEELTQRIEYYEKKKLLLEKERIRSRTLYDLEMLQSLGFCPGVENYSRHLSGRAEGEPPYTLLDYFPEDFILFIDESHVTLPQVRAMYNGDRARKASLVEYGFRLPSALDNRPLQYDEFKKIPKQTVYVSATPSDYELEKSMVITELINRPTGLLDPEIEVRPCEGQVEDLLMEIKATCKKNQRVLITTLTKKMAEDFSQFLNERQINATYIHSDIDTLERVEIIQKLRAGIIDVLVGINLLREGLDIPEVALVAIMDADKVGFLRSYTALIQSIGRAARNIAGHAILYGDRISDSMQKTIDVTNRRRAIQIAYNKKNNITPISVSKSLRTILQRDSKPKEENTNTNDLLKKLELEKLIATTNYNAGPSKKHYEKTTTNPNIKLEIPKLELQMQIAADAMNFEKAIMLRDVIKLLKNR